MWWVVVVIVLLWFVYGTSWWQPIFHKLRIKRSIYSLLPWQSGTTPKPTSKITSLATSALNTSLSKSQNQGLYWRLTTGEGRLCVSLGGGTHVVGFSRFSVSIELELGDGLQSRGHNNRVAKDTTWYLPLSRSGPDWLWGGIQLKHSTTYCQGTWIYVCVCRAPQGTMLYQFV